MPNLFQATVDRIDFEPKQNFLDVAGPRTWAHIFFRPRVEPTFDAYTDDIVLQSATLALWRPKVNPDCIDCPDLPPLVIGEYEEVQNVKRLIRLTLDYNFP